MRSPVTRERIELFLRELGRRVERPARLVITGGAFMIYRGLRGKTLDIDVSYELAPEDDALLATAIRELKEALDLNVELAEPGQFIPLPAGRRERCAFVGRFGGVDVFLDDPYAIALSKLHRGHDKDLDDVRLMEQAKLLDLAELEAKAREIATPGRPGALRVDLERLLARLSRVRG